MTHDEQIDAFIRDVTQAGSIPKSEVRRRLKEMEAEHTKKIIEALEGISEQAQKLRGKRTDEGIAVALALDEAIERIKGLDGQPSS